MGSQGVILLVDSGNSRVKFGWLHPESGEREAEPLALAHSELDAFGPWLTTLARRPFSAVGVNVAGDAIASAIESTCAAAGAPMLWLSSAAEAAGISNLYDAPTQLGADRWISLIGLAGQTHGAAILASFGTATTVDTLSATAMAPACPVATAACPSGEASDQKPLPTLVARRRFEGGIILPGPELMRRALAHGTARLPYAEGAATPFPRNTHAAITSGIAAAQAGAVLHQWRNTVELVGVAPTLYCTGGGWPLVADDLCAALARQQADLGLPAQAPQWLASPVLDGLAAMAKELKVDSSNE